MQGPEADFLELATSNAPPSKPRSTNYDSAGVESRRQKAQKILKEGKQETQNEDIKVEGKDGDRSETQIIIDAARVC